MILSPSNQPHLQSHHHRESPPFQLMRAEVLLPSLRCHSMSFAISVLGSRRIAGSAHQGFAPPPLRMPSSSFASQMETLHQTTWSTQQCAKHIFIATLNALLVIHEISCTRRKFKA